MLNQTPVLTVGVDVGGTSVRAGVVDAAGEILDVVRAGSAGDEAAVEGTIAGAVKELGARHRIAAVGLAVAGFVTPDRRSVRFAPHLPWRDADRTHPLADRMAERCGLPVVIEHDANAAALAEQRFGAGSPDAGGRGPGEGWSSTVFVALGTGIGAALLVEGRLYRGSFGVAPELGHVRVVPGGRACDCGKSGCWERYCSGTALVATYDELVGEPSGRTGLEVADAARAGDPAAVGAVAELARWLGEGLALVADVFDPELVVIGGGVSGSADLFLDAAREHYAVALTGYANRPAARVRVARLGENGAVVGAAQLARERLERRASPNT